MVEKSLIDTICGVKDLEGKEFCLKYFLVEEQVCFDGGFGICTYGIEIVKTGADFTESKTIPSLSSDKNELLSLIDKMVCGLVTPMSLKDIVHDTLCEKCERIF